ncbi:hypothetical protein LCGC14_1633740 [marine sediment metagenome]|uniref:Uncharacterized protein n=1 Tax=marine sediment metagenome TaxID=412755 RepID=A0A0F9IP35_9ZZZZ
MGNELYLSDNAGHRVPPAGSPDPILASGQWLQADQSEAKSTTVVAGATYAFTATRGGSFYFGIAAVATAANVVWACGLYDTIIIVIPTDYTTLYYSSSQNNGNGRLRRLTD